MIHLLGSRRFFRIVGTAMKDMRAHLARLRDQAAECAMLSAEATTREKRSYFATLNRHLTDLADKAEAAINGTAIPDPPPLDRKTQ
jgi:hypothetical protein